MALNAKALGLAGGILWGVMLLVLTLVSVYTGYAATALGMLATLYPGYSVTLVGSLIGLVYGFIDAFIGLWIFAWLYNKFSGE